jgi:hypothetical protein
MSLSTLATIVVFQDLLQLGKLGDNGPDGNNTVWNLAALIGMKEQNIIMDQAADPQVRLPVSTDVSSILFPIVQFCC